MRRGNRLPWRSPRALRARLFWRWPRAVPRCSSTPGANSRCFRYRSDRRWKSIHRGRPRRSRRKRVLLIQRPPQGIVAQYRHGVLLSKSGSSREMHPLQWFADHFLVGRSDNELSVCRTRVCSVRRSDEAEVPEKLRLDNFAAFDFCIRPSVRAGASIPAAGRFQSGEHAHVSWSRQNA
jgi:hypothetical protein